MRETLKMMKAILNGKEGTKDKVQLIDEYKDNLSPNILAYFFVHNFGLITKISNKYPKLDENDKASFCLQELDNCLQRFDETQNVAFENYFAIFYKYRLSNEQKALELDKRKSMNCYVDFDELINIGQCDYIQDYNLILDDYGLTLQEKKQCKLMLSGYTIKEISKLFNVSVEHLYYMNSKIKQKILNLI